MATYLNSSIIKSMYGRYIATNPLSQTQYRPSMSVTVIKAMKYPVKTQYSTHVNKAMLHKYICMYMEVLLGGRE